MLNCNDFFVTYKMVTKGVYIKLSRAREKKVSINTRVSVLNVYGYNKNG